VNETSTQALLESAKAVAGVALPPFLESLESRADPINGLCAPSPSASVICWDDEAASDAKPGCIHRYEN
jgi:hypothetical protein